MTESELARARELVRLAEAHTYNYRLIEMAAMMRKLLNWPKV